MAKVYLHSGKEKRVLEGHPWIFKSDIASADKSCQPGDVVSVMTRQGAFLARALYNPHSQITLRIMSREDVPIDNQFVADRVRRAVAYRRRFADLKSSRLIHAEADGLPALVVDSFGDCLSVQCLSLGMEAFLPSILDALEELLSPAGIWERNDVPVRRLEGMEERTGLLRGTVPEKVQMTENEILFWVDIQRGQKTGYFLDQKENRAAMAPFVRGGHVLDCFSHTGSFALHARRYGAQSVTAVDISDYANQCAAENAALNGFDQMHFVTSNAFDYLREQERDGSQYDAIILDPPAFAKNKSSIETALRGYKEINLRAMKLLKDGGYLVTCSCSQHIVPAMFRDMLLKAAQDAGVSLMQVDFRSQGRDHPVLPAALETQYLKCGIYRVDK